MVIGFTITSPLVLTANATTTIETDSTDDSELAVADASFAQTTQNVTVPVNGTTSNGTNVTQPVRYVNPDELEAQEIRPQASLSSAGIQLARSLGVRLTISADELAEQDYEAASETLGAAYRSDVVRLTDIAEATENTSDDQLAAAFREAQINQRAAIETGTEYRQLYQQYQQARANQNETEARQIARRLSDRFTELNNTATNLTAVSETIASLNESRAQQIQQRINTTLEQVESATENAQRATYINTTITAIPSRNRTSPPQSFAVAGQLRATNDSGNRMTLTNRTVALETPRGDFTTTTNGSGHFTITYVPVSLVTGENELTVKYVPEATAGYLGSRTTVPMRVVAQFPTITRFSVPETISNNVRMATTATGYITVANETLADVPVSISINNRVLGQSQTNASGYVSIPFEIPLSTPDGPAELTIQAGKPDTAVAARQLSRSVTVRPIQTNLSMTGSRITNQTLRVDGQLTRNGTEPIINRSVTILADGRVIALFETDSNGAFNTNLTLPETHPALTDTQRVVNLTARFRSPSTHLSATTTRASVTLSPYTGVFGYGITPVTWTLGGGVGIILVGATAVLLRRQNTRDSESDDGYDVSLDNISTEDDTNVDNKELSLRDLSALYREAQSVATANPERATRLGYVTVRQHLANTLELTDHSDQDSLTHWDFYNRVADSTDDTDNPVDITTLTTHGNTLDTFKRLTRLYEQTVYTTESIDSDTIVMTLEPFETNFTTETNQDMNGPADETDE
ncbi:probable extracellular mucin-like protein [Haloquadratum walsbyi DSM 16790]|uniref:Probable extracellular mucin-like protein n=2 Tax=Haloquadratum walsbyi TaxID=293091 RepID=Q18EP7_HALWD|nr:probable extracellular mucin-like protein [Haloquadratum walsbyi DSM 16790]